MNRYVDWLNLDFDPFASDATPAEFYCSGHRQQLLDQVVEFSLYSNAMIAVTGPLGSGKSTLAGNFRERFAEEAVCIRIAATLFMNQGQFLEALEAGLPFKFAADSDVDSIIRQISQFSAELDLEARSLILIIDDAHELGAEVLKLLTKLLESSVDASIHALLFGENQLDSLLQGTLSDEAQERLAVFPLEGFGSDETDEYIRFKLVEAGHQGDLPLSGDIVNAIHNSAEGMPGLINKLVTDALNAASPGYAAFEDDFEDDLEDDEVEIGPAAKHQVAEEVHAQVQVQEIEREIEQEQAVEQEQEQEQEQEREGFAPMFSGERMEQLDELVEEEVDDEGDEMPPAAWIGGIQSRYWIAAASLVVLLTGTLLFWDTEPTESAVTPIPVAVVPDAPQLVEPVAPPAIEEAAQSPQELVAAIEETVPEPESVPIPLTDPETYRPLLAQVAEQEDAAEQPAVNQEPEEQAAPEVVVAEVVEPEPVEAVEPQVLEEVTEEVPEQAPETSELAAASPFEERLLRASPQNFAVQLLASHSEANIRAFVEQVPRGEIAGYFETRHQGRPWFVALLASFADRGEATDAISALPADLRSNQPWVRSLSGIQSDIRELMDSKLLSSQ